MGAAVMRKHSVCAVIRLAREIDLCLLEDM
jgi:hypothetical protein